uniref:Reticulon domain-containing protein n=1 Tax=Lygus hesperus TaxID=30085 RepID=A0A0K8SC94_LYGHE
MEFFKKFRWFRPTPKQKPPAPESELAKKLKPYEFYLYKIQEIAIWEDPSDSILALFGVNAVFWVLSFFQWRFYGLLFSILCLMVAHEAWVEHIWPEIRVPPSSESPKRPEVLPLKEGMLSVPEISHYATGLRAAVSGQYARLRLLRQTQPPVYCVVVSAGCLVAAGVGSVFSGATLIYLFAMVALIAPGVVKHLLPPEWKCYILQVLKSASTIIVPPEVNMDDYYPDATSKENAAVLRQAGDNHDLSPPSTSDSSLGDLMMPGHDESSLDVLDSLLPTIPQESSRESSDSEGALRFRPSHFNGASSMAAHDDSTDEESSLVKDLDFPDVGPTTSSSLKDTVVSTLYRTFPKAFTPQKPVFTRLEDSDSEFEIIETEDAS